MVLWNTPNGFFGPKGIESIFEVDAKDSVTYEKYSHENVTQIAAQGGPLL